MLVLKSSKKMKLEDIKFRVWLRKRKVLVYFELGEGVYGSNEDYMQFTGLKDKLGKEIYEGDILRHNMKGKFYWDWIVEWDSNGGYVLKGIQEDIKDSEAFTMDNEVRSHTIIGNVYENKDLLNGNTINHT